MVFYRECYIGYQLGADMKWELLQYCLQLCSRVSCSIAHKVFVRLVRELRMQVVCSMRHSANRLSSFLCLLSFLLYSYLHPSPKSKEFGSVGNSPPQFTHLNIETPSTLWPITNPSFPLSGSCNLFFLAILIGSLRSTYRRNFNFI